MERPVSLYIHIPFCHKKCDYCDFFSIACKEEIPDLYIRSLVNEALYYKRKYDIPYWDTVYIGGGTPSLLSARQMLVLIGGVMSLADYHSPREFTIEMNPESVTGDKISVCMDQGVTRLSLGLQSRSQKSLDTVKRNCSLENQNKAMEIIKKYWHGLLNLDVIAGLPYESKKDFLSGLEEIMNFSPDHISMYSLMIEEGTPLYAKVENNSINVDENLSDELWFAGRDLLSSKGFKQYEVSNFAKDNCRSLHNMAYWNQDSYIGIGCGAAGTMYDFEKKSDKNPSSSCNAVRWSDSKNIDQYISFWSSFDTENSLISEAALPCSVEILDKEVLEFEYLMMGLRTLDGISENTYSRRYYDTGKWKGDLYKRLYDKTSNWRKFESLGYVNINRQNGDTFYSLNEKGIMFLNDLLLSF